MVVVQRFWIPDPVIEKGWLWFRGFGYQIQPLGMMINILDIKSSYCKKRVEIPNPFEGEGGLTVKGFGFQIQPNLGEEWLMFKRFGSHLQTLGKRTKCKKGYILDHSK
ncbi:hypothetical protein ACJMK2_013266 [Sinanodonta woodiana]|uniref:Uncharacterized protein n=1 Tax=Sinanodonta woodiana TaxID=1069815 RepID=A0ABD3UZ26_SINWO